MPDDGEDGVYFYDPVQPNKTIPSFPTPSGITEELANAECEQALRESESGKICLQLVPDLDIDGIKESCVEDAKVSFFILRKADLKLLMITCLSIKKM